MIEEEGKQLYQEAWMDKTLDELLDVEHLTTLLYYENLKLAILVKVEMEAVSYTYVVIKDEEIIAEEVYLPAALTTYWENR